MEIDNSNTPYSKNGNREQDKVSILLYLIYQNTHK